MKVIIQTCNIKLASGIGSVIANRGRGEKLAPREDPSNRYTVKIYTVALFARIFHRSHQEICNDLIL